MNPVNKCCNKDFPQNSGRREWLKTGLAASSVIFGASLLPFPLSAASLTPQQRKAMAPDQVLEMLREGNNRFRSGKMRSHDFPAQRRATAGGQYPAAIVLSCIDSRTPPEILFDTGLGETFGARMAGNIVTGELIGSMEFACAVAGAKLVLIVGHTACGAVAGAIDNVKLGNLSGLLELIHPAVELTQYEGERTTANLEFVNAVARTNVIRNIGLVREQSPLLAKLEREGDIRIVGAMYDLNDGMVTFLEAQKPAH